jgi:hypothetical protein
MIWRVNLGWCSKGGLPYSLVLVLRSFLFFFFSFLNLCTQEKKGVQPPCITHFISRLKLCSSICLTFTSEHLYMCTLVLENKHIHKKVRKLYHWFRWSTSYSLQEQYDITLWDYFMNLNIEIHCFIKKNNVKEFNYDLFSKFFVTLLNQSYTIRKLFVKKITVSKLYNS